MQDSRREHGFTLLEVMIVVALIAVFAAVALPAYVGQLPHKRLVNAAQTVVGDLRQARALAVESNTPYFVCFSGTGQYQVDRVNDLSAADCTAANTPTQFTEDLAARFPGVQLGVVAGATGCPSGGVAADSVTFPSDRAVFNPKGSSVTAAATGSPLQASGAIYLLNTQGNTPEGYCIHVQGTVGNVRTYRWDGAAWAQR